MAQVQSHRDLIVWQKAMDLAVAVYRLSQQFPKSEAYGITLQLARAVTSIPANIAEGSARSSRKDYANFLAIAKGSLMEAETLLMLSVRLGYVKDADANQAFGLVTEISKMLTALRAKLL
jgi:four helix bundle protein